MTRGERIYILMSKTNKFILWCVLVAVTSFWMWASVQTWLRGSLFEIQNPINLAILSGLFVVLLSLLSLGFILFKGKKNGLILAGIVVFMYFTLFKVSNFNLVGATALILLFIFIDDLVSRETNERLKINARILVRKGMSNLILGLFILISFAAYQSPAIEQFNNIQKLPSSSEVFIKTIVEQTLSGQVEEAGPQQKELVFNQVTQEVVREANTFLQPYFEYAPPALAFGLFLVLWGVGWIFIWLAVFLGVAVFWILKKIKFFSIEERDVRAEVLVV